MRAKLYVEGGGSNRHYRSKALRASFRQGWHRFFKAAGIQNLPRVVRGEGRSQALKRFSTAVANPLPDTIPLLLVDSEGAVAAGHSVWQHLRVVDSWGQPPGASENQAFLMVQTMETWFLADHKALQKQFGSQFSTSALKPWNRLEDVPKATVLGALRTATARCQKPYSKGRVSFKVLGRLDPSLVESACPHAAALLKRLRSV